MKNLLGDLFGKSEKEEVVDKKDVPVDENADTSIAASDLPADSDINDHPVSDKSFEGLNKGKISDAGSGDNWTDEGSAFLDKSSGGSDSVGGKTQGE